MTTKNGWLWTVSLGTVLGPSAFLRSKRPSPAPQAAPVEPATPPSEPAKSPASGSEELRGNLKTRAFHQAKCRYYDRPDCTAVFASRQEALDAGYTPCKVCKP